ncbi:hypothetical protein [Devosia sp. RR2S18]|uniref:hypothetical protein n=1 Tax=Devosia rhizosphaerae TaxID=3049774 RepID=UPI00254201C2|nr:hypothetical protein [Devosia sp. RR2S18]WIJ25507.1 hypothetical protein QOV41_01665 [Devosia sp. RR2S18]
MKLLLAVDIADRIIRAARRDHKLDLQAEADDLVQRHPEAEVSVEEVVAVLVEEARAAQYLPAV